MKRIGIYFFCVVAFGCVTSSILYRGSEKLKEIRLEKQPSEESVSETRQESAFTENANLENKKSEASVSESEKIIEVSGNQTPEERFLVKEEYGYLVIYDRQSMQQYDETTIPIGDLPIELQSAVREGLYFMNEEALYSFLESYSS